MHIDAQPRIVTPHEVTTEAELSSRAEGALMEQRWQDAVDAYSTLLAAFPTGPHAAEWTFDLGLAQEGLHDRAKARDTFLDVAQRFPDDPKALEALVRVASLDAYLEEWDALAKLGDTLLARPDIGDIDRLVALGARGLARVELGDDLHASTDILDGLDLADRLHYGERDVLPVAVAQLRFALGELRRTRSEQIHLVDVPLPAFVGKLEERCGGLLEAQAAYAQAVRSVDPHWAAMSGTRVGAMYLKLHDELMQIPPPATAKTEHRKAVFFAMMHMRYRVLLEKGLKELDQTIALGQRTGDTSSFIERAHEVKDHMQAALADEEAQMAKMPFTEDEVKRALDVLERKAPEKKGTH
ncbi:MAG: tetratricopeptide repeat protein [Polyangiaceae bacterium]